MKKKKTVKIGKYIFNVLFSDTTPGAIVSSTFILVKITTKEMTKTEIDRGRKIQQNMFDGKHRQLLDRTDWDIIC